LPQNNIDKEMTIKAIAIRKSGWHRSVTKMFVLSAILAVLLVDPALAAADPEISKLVRAGQYAEALSKVDAALAM
jgi:hypothetical protein